MRIRLSNQIATGLRNVLYILDEPSAGLHPSDHHRLLKILRELVNKGNTVIAVEHDEQTMRAADHIIDIGPGPGNEGGEIVYNGPADFFLTNKIPNSKTSFALERKKAFPTEAKANDKYLSVQNANLNNLKNINVRFAEGGFNVITGVSGAGKSSLVMHFLNQTVKHKDGGTDVFRKVIFVDQSPIGRTPKSNPATYTGMSDAIRDLLAAQPESKKAGYKKGQFSFVVKGGRCEDCGGAGVQQMGMHFLGNVNVLCETCNGRRFTEETLAIQYSGKNIFEILELSVEEAHHFFSAEKKIRAYTSLLLELGLGYLRLGQPSTTLSGGEAQRIKLATELVKSSGGKILYILDEPTTGLHSADVDVLVSALRKLTQKGNTLITVEHHEDFILAADNIVDLGPGSGSEGGSLLFEGCPGEMLKSCKSPTAVELRNYLSAGHEMKKAETTNELALESPIILEGVCTNNLQSVHAEFESEKITCITGVSGSGKSSLVCDTLYAESQRRFMDGMSSYIRQFIGKTGNPVLDSSHGITPAITVLKKNTVNNPRSTTGTYTGVYDLYRMMFSRISTGKDGLCTLLSSAFSFNHEAGACPACRGLGEKTVCNPQKLVTHPGKSLLDGALDGTKTGRFYGDPFGQYTATLRTVGTRYGVDFSKAFDALSEKEVMLAMRGCGDEVLEVNWNYKRGNVEGTHHFKGKWPGFLGLVEEEYHRKHADHRGESMLPVMMSEICTECKGHRINPKNLEYQIGELNIGELTCLSAEEAVEWLDGLNQNKVFTGLGGEVFGLLLPEIRQKLDSLIRSGLGYIQLNRKVSSLSGGEYQRLKIAGMMKSGLVGLTCILDEPSFGLHSKDTERMSSLIRDLYHEGNTVVMIEQSEQMLNLAHRIIELGPGAGKNGGKITYSGSGEDYIQYKPTMVERKLSQPGPGIVIRGARANNLKNLDVEFPSNCFSVICGLSGSGKTSLLNDVIYESLITGRPVKCDSVLGREHFNKIVYIHQDVPSGSSLSTSLTYLGLSDAVRRIFSSTESARKKEMGSSHFSWQSKDGQCPSCQGHGGNPVSLDFWSDAWVVCDECSGSRYKPEVLAIEADGLNMAKLLNISLSELGIWFGKNAEPKDLKKHSMIFELAEKTGISHLPAGQALNTMSTGELQRLKLVEGLASAKAEKTLFLLDEPTGGLHTADVEKLLALLGELTEKGATTICVSHNDLLIQTASLVVELGPGGGNKGGMVINKTVHGMAK
jgi:excinuclease ABC subunit A